MVIVGTNLKSLIQQSAVCEEQRFDEFSISLTLGSSLIVPKENASGVEVRYDKEDVASHFEPKQMERGEFVLLPRHAVLGCSNEVIRMPLGYIGLLQTKGTLARLFVSVHACDSQVEPGFGGKITFELLNFGPFAVKLSAGDSVAQLFILKCSTDNPAAYSGRYQDATGPTIHIPRNAGRHAPRRRGK